MTPRQLYKLALKMEAAEEKAKQAREAYDKAFEAEKLDYELWQHSAIHGKEGYHWRAKFYSSNLKWARRSKYYAKESDALADLVAGKIEMLDLP